MTVVVKQGGARTIDPSGVVADVAALTDEGERVIVVHGGSTAVDDLLSRLGIEPRYVETPSGVTGRFTDAETMEAFIMAMAGTVNTDLVAQLRNADVDALGLSGVDGGLLTGRRKSAIRVVEDGRKRILRGDHSGTVDDVNGGLLERLLAAGYTPVTGPPVLADDGVPVNADADRVAAAVAGALEASLVLLTDVEGVYADPDDPGTRFERVETPADLQRATAAAEGFMGRKVMAATEALERGSEAVVVGDAGADEPVRSALAGEGTHLLPSAVDDETAVDGEAALQTEGVEGTQ